MERITDTSARRLVLAALLAAVAAPAVHAGGHDAHLGASLRQLPEPRQRTNLPPSADELKYGLTPARVRPDLADPKKKAARVQRAATPTCKDPAVTATYSGAALADYIANLPDVTCTYPLFSAPAAQASTIFSAANLSAVADRFLQESYAYDASNRKLANLAVFFRAGYYQAYNNSGVAVPSAGVLSTLRTAIKYAVDNPVLFRDNPVESSTAGETIRLITNMHDEAYFLPSMKNIVQRYTNTTANPNAAQGLRNATAGPGFTSVLTVINYGHGRPDGKAILSNDISYSNALSNFVIYDKYALLGTSDGYQLNDASNEAWRFMQYDNLKPSITPMVQYVLRYSSMTGADDQLWINAAMAVRYYDAANCSAYGTCGFEDKLASAVLVNNYVCSPTIKIRSQKLTPDQATQACSIMQKEESYFHDMMQTGRKPVANDNNSALEVVVFDDYTNYSKYASAIFDMSTDNGGMYLEGNPASPTNQARFVAHRASWLPDFQIWNLEHEYIHYLDGRFDMLGDFDAGTVKPTVWYIEGLAEYLSHRNNYQEAIDIAKTGKYKLSTIFANTYGMDDYVTRAYRWGYMATRFMFERHRADVDAVVARFRVGDYDGYQAYMNNIGTRYDAEFAGWVQAATTAGEPPMPSTGYPACSSTSQLGKNCSIYNLGSSGQSYAYILLPSGAKNLRLSTAGGTGDADLYVALDRYPTTTSYDAASATAGNRESVSIPAPATGRWYYIVLNARQPFSGLTLSATYD